MIVIHRRDRHRYPGRTLVYLTRGTLWGNPHPHGTPCGRCHVVHTRAQCIEAFRQDWESPAWEAKRARALRELPGTVGLCWCAPEPCHGQVIADYVNAQTP